MTDRPAADRPTADRPTRVLQVLGSSAGGVGRHVGQISAALGAPAPAPARALPAAGVEVRVAGPESVRALVVTAPDKRAAALKQGVVPLLAVIALVVGLAV